MRKYKNLIFAGTFDHLHIGHKKLLDKAFQIAERVSVGITTDEMVKVKFLSQTIETLDFRRKSLEKYLKIKGCYSRARIFLLHDIYGPSTSLRVHPEDSPRGVKPSISDNSFDAILVTKSTKANAKKINKVRKRKGLKELTIIVEDYVRGNDGGIVTSERIRMGEIDREGHSYKIFFSKKLFLPKKLRGRLRTPLGKVVSGGENQLEDTARKVLKSIKSMRPFMLVSVGDVVTMSLEKVGYVADVNILDLRSRRVDMHEAWQKKYEQLQKYSNPAGTIEQKAVSAIHSVIRNFILKGPKACVVIKGEEDLLTLPAILLAPFGSIVLYGQMNLGVVVVAVTEEKKEEVAKIIDKFV